MSDKQPPKAEPTPTKSYEENAEDQQGLLEAAAAVPIKDYSDYEITIETKDEYADALFADESELDSALNEAEDAKTNPQPLEEKPAIIEDSIFVRDFSLLLSEQSTAGAFTPNDNAAKQKLAIINNSLNHSPARKTIAATELSKAFETTLEDIAATLLREEAEAKAEKEKAQQAEPTPVTEGSKLSTITQKLKAKGKALSQKGLAKMDQSKAELDEYLGRSLPDRTIALEFMLPTVKAKKEADDIVTEKEIEKLFTTKGKPLGNIFAKAEQDLATLAKSPLSNSKRLTLLNRYFSALSEKIKSLIAMIERKPSIYEDEKRAAMIDSSLNSLKHLITGYKQIYADLYESANVVYGPQRKTANQVAFILFDCLYLEQLLSVALHTQIPSTSIKTVNKLYHILSHYEPQQLMSEEHAYSLAKSTNIDTLFIYYQIFATLDTLSISTAQQRLLHAYLQTLYPLVKTIPLAISARLPSLTPQQQLLAIDHNTSTTGRLISHTDTLDNNHSELPAVYLLIQPLFNQIKADYVQALKLRMSHRSEHSATALSGSPIEHTLSLLSALNLSIRHIEKASPVPTYTLYKGIDLKAYSGLEDIINYNHYDYALQQKGPIQKGQPVGDLPVKPPASKSTWQCAMEDEQTIYLQTIECKLGVPMDIGRLVELIKTVKTVDEENDEETEVEELLLAVITRLERSSQGKISLVASIISRDFSPIAIQDQHQALIAKTDNQSLLISQPKEQHWNGKVTSITFPDKTSANIAVTGLTHVTDNIQLLHLS